MPTRVGIDYLEPTCRYPSTNFTRSSLFPDIVVSQAAAKPLRLIILTSGFGHPTYARAFLSPKFQAAISSFPTTIFQRNFGVCLSPGSKKRISDGASIPPLPGSGSCLATHKALPFRESAFTSIKSIRSNLMKQIPDAVDKTLLIFGSRQSAPLGESDLS
ncbi:hypothetical protein [Microseira sp. BLCC-F43]|jgi:hypothetical protein|uniref:hypothetical protein n=1 Tax=Microseira sp. BLCC-F43 TaxID=3153602 RepID=UPI0035B7D295